MGGAGFGFGVPQGAAGPSHGPPGGGQGGTPMTLQDTVMGMMDAITQSTVHTNQRFAQFADHMGYMQQQNAQHMHQLGQAMQQGMGKGSGDDAGGYRALKPKKEITAITADNAAALMMELDQFEVDMGELGVHLQTEAAYRQLRAMCSGKARDVIDLEVEVPQGKALKLALDDAVSRNVGKAQRDFCGARLYSHMVQALEKSVRLTPDKRCEIAQDKYSEARMLGDTVADAEVFLCKWRQARRLMYKEDLVEKTAKEMFEYYQQFNITPEGLQELLKMCENRDKALRIEFMNHRISASVYEHIMGCKPVPDTLDEMIAEIEVWIRKKSCPQRKTMASHGVIRVMEGGKPVFVVNDDETFVIENTAGDAEMLKVDNTWTEGITKEGLVTI